MSFWEALFSSRLLLAGVLGGALAGLAGGLVGPLVVGRGMVFLVGAIAHIAVGGVGAAIFLRERWGWPVDPVHGALAAALLAAVALAWVRHRVRERLDTLIGALWAVGMAGGLVLVRMTDNYHVELMSYLFGNLSLVGWRDVLLLAVLDVVLVSMLLLWHKRLMAVGLDQEHARLQGVSPLVADAVLLSLVAISAVLLTQVVGLILVIALVALPAATAAQWATRMGGVTMLAIVIALLETLLPRAAVYGTRVSPESAIVLTAGAVYLLSAVLSRLYRRRVRTG